MRQPADSFWVRVVIRGGLAMAALASEPLRSRLRHDGAAALVSSCQVALVRHGRLGAIAAVLAEWGNLLMAAVRSRFRKPVPVTYASHSPRGPRSDQRERGPVLSRVIDRCRQDAHQTWRGLRGSPGTVTVAVLSLAIGIGVNTAAFSILDALLFRPVPFAEAERLASLWSYYAPGKFTMKGGFGAALVAEWRTQTDLFDRVEATESKSFVYENDSGSTMVAGAAVTPGLFSMLGVFPSSGRPFVDGDGRAGTDRIAIVSDTFWRQQLGGDRAAIGRQIVLDGQRYDVVGIMAPAFQYPDRSHQVWVPIDVAQPPTGPAAPSARFLPVVRLVRGLTLAQANERASARGPDVSRRSGGDPDASARVVAIGELDGTRESQSLVVLGGAVLFVLLIVCANVAGLALARSLARARDRAIRVALGASRADLFRAALLEHAAIGVAGAVAGLGLARLVVTAATSLMPEAMTLASLNAIDIDDRTLLFLVAIAVFSLIAFGVPPAWLATRRPTRSALQLDSRVAGGSRTARRLRSTLVIVEVALSIVLLVGAALMTRSLLKLEAIDTGLDTTGLLTVQVGLPVSAYGDVDSRRVFRGDLLARLAARPDVTGVTAGTLPPTRTMIAVGAIAFDDREGPPAKSSMLTVLNAWPDYFRTAGIRLVEGRGFRTPEVPGAAVVSAGFAAKHWPGRSPLGVKFRIGKGEWRTVVGVAAEVRRMSEDDDSRENEIYYPHDQVSGVMVGTRLPAAIAEYWTIILRADDPSAIARALPAAVHAVDRRVIVMQTRLVSHEFADAIARPRIVMAIMTTFAAIGLALAAFGLFGLLSYMVAQRTREIGIRLALGARPRDIGRLVFGGGLALAGVGLAIGLPVSLAAVRAMRALLYAVEPTDSSSIALVLGIVVLTALAASWWPARRAMRVDPVVLLRSE